jgi:hypothetical protein
VVTVVTVVTAATVVTVRQWGRDSQRKSTNPSPDYAGYKGSDVSSFIIAPNVKLWKEETGTGESFNWFFCSTAFQLFFDQVKIW